MALTPGVQISKGIQPTDPVPVDSWSGPYEGATEALAKTQANSSVPSGVRFKSLEVRLIINGVAKKYWYRDGITDNDLVEFSSSLGMGGGDSVVSKTYAELKVLKDANQLVAGQYYKITDFRTMWWNRSINDNTVKTSLVIEPLIVYAIKSNNISNVCYSELYPQDIIYYDIDATYSTSWGYDFLNFNTIPNFKGWIYRRVDTKNNIDIAGYDWRHITVNCCKADFSSIPTYSTSVTYNQFSIVKSGGKLYYSLQNNNLNKTLVSNNLWWFPVSEYNEENVFFPTDESYGLKLYKPNGNHGSNWGSALLLNVPALTSTRIQQFTFTNSITSQGTFYLNNSYDIRIEGLNNFSNVIHGESFTNNIILNGFKNNLINSNFKYNKISNDFNNNIIGSYFTKNEIGSFFTSNITHTIVNSNTTNSDFKENIIGPYFEYNKLGSNIWGNLFGYNLTYNTFLDSVYSNLIGSVAIYNSFKSNVKGNVLLGEFNYNNIGNVFLDNTINIGFVGNVLGVGAKNNIINSYMNGNTILNEFSNNAIGTEFQFNNVKQFFQNSTIGNNCIHNSFTDYITLTAGNNFRKNNLEYGKSLSNQITPIDFTSATHVYNFYNKTLFRNANGDVKLSYYDSNDYLTLANPNN